MDALLLYRLIDPLSPVSAPPARHPQREIAAIETEFLVALLCATLIAISSRLIVRSIIQEINGALIASLHLIHHPIDGSLQLRLNFKVF